jgi:hypothetical protein
MQWRVLFAETAQIVYKQRLCALRVERDCAEFLSQSRLWRETNNADIDPRAIKNPLQD